MTIARERNRALFFSDSQWGDSRALEPLSGAGGTFTATGGTTSTVNCAGAAAGWVGGVIDIQDGDNQGHRAIVVSVSAGTSATFWPAAGSAVSNGDTFKLYSNPIPVIVASGAGTTTTVIDSSRSEGDDEFNGHYLMCIAGSSIAVGECKQITDYTASSTTFTTEAFSAASASGDVFAVVKPLLAEDLEFSYPQEMIDRSPVRDSWNPVRKVPGAKRPTVGFKLPLQAYGTGAGDGTDIDTLPVRSAPALLSSMFGTQTNDEGEVILSGSTTTSVNITLGTKDQFTIGNGVLINGEVRIITASSTDGTTQDTLTVAPALSQAPAANDVAYACSMIRYATSGHYPLTFWFFDDQVLYIGWSCMGKVTLETEHGGRAMLNFSFDQCQSWSASKTTNPVALDDSHYPESDITQLRAIDCPVLIGGSAIEVTSVAIDPAIQISERPDVNTPEGSRGGMATHAMPVLTLTGHPKEDATYELARLAKTTFASLIQIGSKPGNVFATWMPRTQITDISTDTGDGIVRQTVTLAAVEPASSDPLGDSIIILFA